jgi:two-component system OmpR family sensor kinase
VPALAETGVVTILVLGGLWQVDRLDDVDFGQPGRDIFMVLALAAAGVAAAAAVMARISSASAATPNRRLALPLAFYAVAMIPAGVIESAPGWVDVAGFAASGSFLILVTGALATRRSIRKAWPAVPVCVALVAVLTGAIVQDISAASALASRITVSGWWLASAGFVVVGALRHRPSTWRIGIGLSMIAWAHLEDFTSPAGIHLPDLEFGALRLLGLLLVLFVLAPPADGAVRTAGALERGLVERDHEIRNVLYGLSGVSHLLCQDTDTLGRAERAALVSAVHAELDRMRELLGANAATISEYSLVSPVLTRLVALRRARGEHVGLVVHGRLRVSIPAHELAQVVTNLLANCDRHAHGSRVQVSARAEGELVCIAVTDEGPGLACGAVDETQYNASAGGMGIGLRVCRRLLHAHDGTLSLRTTAKGCRAEVRLPGAVETPLPRKMETLLDRRTAKRVPIAACAESS